MKGVFLFRHDLRLRDHPALNEAVSRCSSLAFALKEPTDFNSWGEWRQKFWIESVRELKISLEQKGHELFFVSSDELFQDFVNSILSITMSTQIGETGCTWQESDLILEVRDGLTPRGRPNNMTEMKSSAQCGPACLSLNFLIIFFNEVKGLITKILTLDNRISHNFYTTDVMKIDICIS